MKMNRRAKLGEKVLVEAEVLSDRIEAEGDGLTVDYYKVRILGHAKPIAVVADALYEPFKPNYYQTDVDFDRTRTNFARVLRAYRQKANLSQWELAERLGIGQNTIVSWESGKFMPRFDKVPVIVSFLGIPLEELFDY